MSSKNEKKTPDKEKLEAKLSEVNVSISKISQEIRKLKDERQSLNLMSFAMTNDLENIQGLPEEQKNILLEVQNRQKEANKVREMRDKINSNIILPEQAILENLYLYYYRLTGEEADLRYPTLKKETVLFARFMELQQMFSQKIKSTDYHNQYQELMNEQLSTIDKLNEIRKKSGNKKLVISKGNRDSKSPVGFKIYKINKKIASNSNKLNHLRKEKGKIESSLGRKGSRRKKYNMPDLSRIQERISEGGSLSLDDLGALLKHGKGIQDIEKSIPKSKNTEKKSKAIQRKRVQTSRGRRRAGPRDTTLKNDR